MVLFFLSHGEENVPNIIPSNKRCTNENFAAKKSAQYSEFFFLSSFFLVPFVLSIQFHDGAFFSLRFAVNVNPFRAEFLCFVKR